MAKKKSDTASQADRATMLLERGPSTWPSLSADDLYLALSMLQHMYGANPASEVIRPLNFLHGLAIERFPADKRMRLLQEAIYSVSQGACRTDIFMNYLYCEPDQDIVIAVVMAMMSFLPRQNDDPMTGPQYILQMALRMSDAKQKIALLSVLLTMGDDRLHPLLDHAWDALTDDERIALMGARSALVTTTTVSFLVNRLTHLDARANPRVFHAVAVMLARLPREAVDATVWGIERVFPSETRDGEPQIIVRSRWSVPEYGQAIAPALTAVSHRGGEPESLLPVFAAWEIPHARATALSARSQPQRSAGTAFSPDDEADSEARAAVRGNTEIIAPMPAPGADATARDSDGNTPRFQAIENGHQDAATMVDDRDVSDTSNEYPPIFAAIRANDIAGLRTIIARGVDIEGKNDADTPLQFAASLGHVQAMRVLLDHGAEIEASGTLGYTPLHRAAYDGHTSAVTLLLKYRANPEGRNGVDGAACTPLHLAAMGGHTSVIQSLLASGADIEALDEHAYSPLNLAIVMEQVSAIKLLLENGADLEQRSARSTSIYLPQHNWRLEATQLLREHGKVDAIELLSRDDLKKMLFTSYLTYSDRSWSDAESAEVVALYRTAVRRLSADERIEILLALYQKVKRSAKGLSALTPFRSLDPDVSVVSAAAMRIAILMPLKNNDPMTGPRHLLEDAKDAGPGAQRMGILNALLLLGDWRILPLLDAAWEFLDDEEREEWCEVRVPIVTPAIVEFFLARLERLDEDEDDMIYGPVGGALARLPENADEPRVQDIERKFPAYAPDDRPKARIVSEWSMADYGRIIAPRLYAIKAREREFTMMPLVLKAWGLPLDEASVPLSQTQRDRQLAGDDYAPRADREAPGGQKGKRTLHVTVEDANGEVVALAPQQVERVLEQLGTDPVGGRKGCQTAIGLVDTIAFRPRGGDSFRSAEPDSYRIAIEAGGQRIYANSFRIGPEEYAFFWYDKQYLDTRASDNIAGPGSPYWLDLQPLLSALCMVVTNGEGNARSARSDIIEITFSTRDTEESATDTRDTTADSDENTINFMSPEKVAAERERGWWLDLNDERVDGVLVAETEEDVARREGYIHDGDGGNRSACRRLRADDPVSPRHNRPAFQRPVHLRHAKQRRVRADKNARGRVSGSP